jgi:hypothetical protein
MKMATLKTIAYSPDTINPGLAQHNASAAIAFASLSRHIEHGATIAMPLSRGRSRRIPCRFRGILIDRARNLRGVRYVA